MLRVGLTGELGSGKSTVARLLAERGAVVLSSDEMGRAMMQPGESVFHAILEHFGPSILAADGTLDRHKLAQLAFDPAHPRVEELNALVHPAVLAAQERRIAALAREQPDAIVVVESALIFTTKHAGGSEPWRNRFDRLVVVTAPEAAKIARFVARSAAATALSEPERLALAREAEARLRTQRLPSPLPDDCLVISNAGDLEALAEATGNIWRTLVDLAAARTPPNV